MNINWEARIKNPVFWVQIGAAILMPILTYAGLTVEDLTTWGALFDLLFNAIQNPFVLGTIAFSVWTAINNPTTKGIVTDGEEIK